MLGDLWLTLLGVVIGAFGTIIGAGGGFILVPVLLFLYPNDPPEVITAISLAVVCVNSISGSIAYGRAQRIDYKSAAIFAAVSVPGAVFGVIVNHWVSRETFQPIFGFALILIAAYLLFGERRKQAHEVGKQTFKRELTDASGKTYTYGYNLKIGILISSVVGFLSSFLGIGGGVIHVPAMTQVLAFPPHIATATSQFVLAITAFVGSAEHFMRGALQPGFDRLLFLAPGVILGAQLGAWLSHKIKGKWILRLLAGALMIVGLRLVF